jgi:hypothetical protein
VGPEPTEPVGVHRMTGPRVKASDTKAKRESEDDADRRFEPKRMFHDIGAPINEADFKPRRICRSPEEIMAAAFIKERCDYGGPLEDLDTLHAVLTQPVEAE